MKYVVAGNYREYLNYCYEKHIGPHSRLLVHVQGVDDLKGVVNPDVVYVGTYSKRPDIKQVVQMARERAR